MQKMLSFYLRHFFMAPLHGDFVLEKYLTKTFYFHHFPAVAFIPLYVFLSSFRPFMGNIIHVNSPSLQL